MLVSAFGHWPGRWWREWRQASHREKKLVGCIEEVQVTVAGTFGGGDEDGGMSRVVDGNVCLESRAAACFFDDVGRRIHWQNVDPSEPDAGWLAGVVEAFLMDEMRRKKVDRLRVRGL